MFEKPEMEWIAGHVQEFQVGKMSIKVEVIIFCNYTYFMNKIWYIMKEKRIE